MPWDQLAFTREYASMQRSMKDVLKSPINHEILNDSKSSAYPKVTNSYKHLYETVNVSACFVAIRKLGESVGLILSCYNRG